MQLLPLGCAIPAHPCLSPLVPAYSCSFPLGRLVICPPGHICLAFVHPSFVLVCADPLPGHACLPFVFALVCTCHRECIPAFVPVALVITSLWVIPLLPVLPPLSSLLPLGLGVHMHLAFVRIRLCRSPTWSRSFSLRMASVHARSCVHSCIHSRQPLLPGHTCLTFVWPSFTLVCAYSFVWPSFGFVRALLGFGGALCMLSSSCLCLYQIKS
jgi:hypothetical protein